MSDDRRLDDAKMQEALAWHLRLRDGDVAEWEHFTRWLESEPANNSAYEAVAACDEQLGRVLAEASFPADARPEPVPANDTGPMPVQTGGNSYRWMALAASLAICAFVAAQMLLTGNDAYTITTQPGETRSVTLTDGGSIEINGGTQITLDRGNPRVAELLAGEAQFSIVHDAGDPFVVTVGESRLVDVGTVFNVVRDDETLRVEVAEGAVRYEGQQTIDLVAGETLQRSADGRIARANRPVEAMGSWVDGMLVYEAAPLTEIAADLSRTTGIPISLAPGLGQRRFSGVIQADGSRELVRKRLQDLLGLAISDDGTSWTIRS